MAPEAVLLLVHGFPLDGRMWEAQVEGLADIRRVIAPDLDGHGSRRDDAPGRSMDEIARALAARLDAEGVDAVDLGGFSMGGYVVLAFRRLFPERVRSLALIDTRAGADSDAGREGRNTMAAGIRERGAVVAAEAMLPKMFTDAIDQDVKVETERWMLDQPPASLEADLMAMRDRPDSTPDLPGIDVPTVVIVGAVDAVTPPSEAEAMAAAIPNSKLVVVSGAAHLSPVERAADVTAALRAHLGG